MTIDNLLAGRARHGRRRASCARATTENAELFWGVRGGGGNLGIVTEFTFRLNPVGPDGRRGPDLLADGAVPGAPALLPRLDRRGAGRADDDRRSTARRRRSTGCPPELHGQLVVGIACCYAGPVEDGERVVRPLKAFGSPVLDLCRPKPYVEHQGMFDPSFPHGRWYYIRACDVAALSRRGDRHHGRALDADPVAADQLPDLAAGRGAGARGRGRDRVQRPRGRAHVQHRRHHGDGATASTRSARGPATSGPRWRRTTRACT